MSTTTIAMLIAVCSLITAGIGYWLGKWWTEQTSESKIDTLIKENIKVNYKLNQAEITIGHTNREIASVWDVVESWKSMYNKAIQERQGLQPDTLRIIRQFIDTITDEQIEQILGNVKVTSAEVIGECITEPVHENNGGC